MKPQYFKRAASAESGVVAAVTAVGILALLAIGGLAIDCGNLYRTKLRLQRAADAGALAALGYRTQRGYAAIFGNDPDDTAALQEGKVALEAIGSAAIQRNLIGADLADDSTINPSDKVSWETSYAVTGLVVEDSVTTTVSYRLTLYIMDKIGLGDVCEEEGCLVRATATAELSPAHVALVLDTSGSMNCPSVGTCECLTLGTCAATFSAADDQKIEILKQAANDFAAFFNPKRDYLTIVPFNTTSNQPYFPIQVSGVSYPFGESPAGRGDFYTAISNITAQGNTNPSEGLMSAYMNLSYAISDNEEVFYVLFSDGAPTAATVAIADPVLDFENAMATNGLTNRYVQYTIEWDDGGTLWRGPSPFVYRSTFGLDETDGVTPLGYDSSPTADPVSSDGTICGRLNSDSADLDASFRSCVENAASGGAYSYTFSIPGADSSTNFTLADPENFEINFYNATIQTADYLRAQNGYLYTISLGELSANTTDAYQDTGDDTSRKDYFLRRVALDWYHADNHGDPNATDDPNNFNFAEYQHYSAFDNEDTRWGESYGTADADELDGLDGLFARVAKNILLRLTK